MERNCIVQAREQSLRVKVRRASDYPPLSLICMNIPAVVCLSQHILGLHVLKECDVFFILPRLPFNIVGYLLSLLLVPFVLEMFQHLHPAHVEESNNLHRHGVLAWPSWQMISSL